MLQQALVKDWGLSIRRSCRLVGLSRSRLNAPYQVQEAALRAEIRRLSYKHPRFGYRRIHALLAGDGHTASLRRVRRIRAKEGLQIKKCHCTRMLCCCYDWVLGLRVEKTLEATSNFIKRVAGTF